MDVIVWTQICFTDGLKYLPADKMWIIGNVGLFSSLIGSMFHCDVSACKEIIVEGTSCLLD